MQVSQPTHFPSAKTPSFKAVNLVKISHKAFANPKNYKECSEVFGKTLHQATGEKLRGFLRSIIVYFTPKPLKTMYIFENPSYRHAVKSMQETGNNYSLNWLKQNTQLPVKDVIDENYHSFYVFTKEHKNGYANICNESIKNISKAVDEGCEKYPNNEKMALLYAETKIGTEEDKAVTKLLENTPVNEFSLQSLDEVKNIVKNLDV